jgi:putative Mn2+ efflux pump MntP
MIRYNRRIIFTLNDEMMTSFRQHVDALILALASSTDNFTVGFSVGLTGQLFPLAANAFIAVCNAVGAFVASYGGSFMGEALPSAAAMLAALAFGYLALKELCSYLEHRQQQQQQNTTSADNAVSVVKKQIDMQNVLGLAIPMTLNNLAGGIAGGAAGLPPTMTATYCLISSFTSMTVGYFLGKRIGSRLPFEPSLLAAFLMGVLCLLTLNEVFRQ